MEGLFANVAAAPAKISSRFGISNVVLYILLLVFVVLVVMMLMNIKLSLSWLVGRKYTVLASSSKFWAPSGVYTNLLVPSKAAPFLTDTVYSIMFEGLLLNSRNYQSSDGPHRHILHRGSKELASSTGGAIVGCAASLSTTDLPPSGLPKRLNPGIFLDPNTNDILVFIDTSDGTNTYRESLRVPDIPLDEPFNMLIVLNGRIVEVYLNCGLEATKVLSGDPSTVENIWYGLSGAASANAQIQNLSIWNTSLTSDDIRSFCVKTPAFRKVRPDCAGADKMVPSSSSPSPSLKTSTTDLGFGIKLNTCL